jgi:pseudouridine-5'-phosphate glycosidase
VTAELVRVSEEVAAALADGSPVVALETTIVAHGFPRGEGIAVGRECEERVRGGGAVPATVGVLDGAVRIGLSSAELERVAAAGTEARKAGPRDLAVCATQRAVGATTVGGTLAASRLVGVRVVATGGIGGVHRGWTERPDVSADLAELARSEAVVVCSGVKSLLDVPATAEALELLGVPLLGWRTDELPLFYTATGGPPVSARIESAADAADIALTHWRLGRNGLVVTRPPEDGLDDVEPLIAEALREASERRIEGQAVTPFVLAYLHDRSDGETLRVNRRLVADNASLAAEIAAELSRGAGAAAAGGSASPR